MNEETKEALVSAAQYAKEEKQPESYKKNNESGRVFCISCIDNRKIRR